MSNKRKTRAHAGRPVPSSGKHLLIPGLGYFRLPATLGDFDDWRQGYRNALGGSEHLAGMDAMAHAITTGESVVDDTDIDGMIIIHRPDGTDVIAHVREVAEIIGGTEATAWESIGELVSAGVLTPCADDDSDNGCADGGYRMTGTGTEAGQLWAPLRSATTERTEP